MASCPSRQFKRYTFLAFWGISKFLPIFNNFINVIVPLSPTIFHIGHPIISSKHRVFGPGAPDCRPCCSDRVHLTAVTRWAVHMESEYSSTLAYVSRDWLYTSLNHSSIHSLINATVSGTGSPSGQVPGFGQTVRVYQYGAVASSFIKSRHARSVK